MKFWSWAIEHTDLTHYLAGHTIQQYRQAMGWSRSRLAKMIGWQQDTILKMENGRMTTYQKCWELAEAIGSKDFDNLLVQLGYW